MSNEAEMCALGYMMVIAMEYKNPATRPLEHQDQYHKKNYQRRLLLFIHKRDLSPASPDTA